MGPIRKTEKSAARRDHQGLARCVEIIPPDGPLRAYLPSREHCTDRRWVSVTSVTAICSGVNGQRATPIDSTTEAARMLKIVEHDALHGAIDR